MGAHGPALIYEHRLGPWLDSSGQQFSSIRKAMRCAFFPLVILAYISVHPKMIATFSALFQQMLPPRCPRLRLQQTRNVKNRLAPSLTSQGQGHTLTDPFTTSTRHRCHGDSDDIDGDMPPPILSPRRRRRRNFDDAHFPSPSPLRKDEVTPPPTLPRRQ